jgi:hypothetical protein
LFWACRRAYGVTWGLEHRVVHWLYVSIIRPSLTFSSLVWWPGCQTASAKTQLSKIQRLAFLGVTGSMRTTPTSALEALVCLPPMELIIQREANLAAHRLWSLGNWFTSIPIEDTAVSFGGFNSRIPYLTWVLTS